MMQVASSQYSTSISASMRAAYTSSTPQKSVRVDVNALLSHTTVKMRKVKEISPLALKVLSYIADSTRLTREEKRTLTRLVAVVDEFAGGNPRLLRDVAGVAKLMELNATHSSPPTPLREILDDYFDERERLRESQSLTIDIDSAIVTIAAQVLETDETSAAKALTQQDATLTLDA